MLHTKKFIYFIVGLISTFWCLLGFYQVQYFLTLTTQMKTTPNVIEFHDKGMLFFILIPFFCLFIYCFLTHKKQNTNIAFFSPKVFASVCFCFLVPLAFYSHNMQWYANALTAPNTYVFCDTKTIIQGKHHWRTFTYAKASTDCPPISP